MGTAASSSTVRVDGAPITKKVDRVWAADVFPQNSTQAATGSANVYARAFTPAGSPDIVRADTSKSFFIPPATQAFSYDADGNLLSDGVWSYSYDAENRLILMDSALPATFVGMYLKLVFTYDYLGRRVEKVVYNKSDGSVKSDTRYLFDGFNLLAELNATGTSLIKSYTWGLDISGSLTSTGGVGALLQVFDHASGRYFWPTYDGNGNVASLVNGATGSLAAAYEYDPYGNPIRGDVFDAVVKSNPWRFSTKYTDTETSLIHYGLRFYSSALGRFINRDPAGELGGINLYAFTGNDPVNRIDYLGLDGFDVFPVTVKPCSRRIIASTRCYTISYVDCYESGAGYEYVPTGGADCNGGSGGGGNNNTGSSDVPISPTSPGKTTTTNTSRNSNAIAPQNKLPPCSGFKNGIIATYQAFISKAVVPDPLGRGSYLGDNRGFTNTPSDTYRTSYTVGFSDQGMPYTDLSVSSSTLVRPDGSRTEFSSNQSVVPNLSLVSGAYLNNSGNIAISHYPISVGVAGVPFSSYVAPIVQATNLQIDLSTGVMSGTITHSGSPSFQLFLNGNEVWQSAEANSGADFLKAIKGEPINETVNKQVCDPTR